MTLAQNDYYFRNLFTYLCIYLTRKLKLKKVPKNEPKNKNKITAQRSRLFMAQKSFFSIIIQKNPQILSSRDTSSSALHLHQPFIFFLSRQKSRNYFSFFAIIFFPFNQQRDLKSPKRNAFFIFTEVRFRDFKWTENCNRRRWIAKLQQAIRILES